MISPSIALCQCYTTHTSYASEVVGGIYPHSQGDSIPPGRAEIHRVVCAIGNGWGGRIGGWGRCASYIYSQFHQMDIWSNDVYTYVLYTIRR